MAIKKRITIKTGHHTEMFNITPAIRQTVAESGIQDGICVVYVPHSSAGLTINENTDPNVTWDVMNALDRLVPQENNYLHNGKNAAAHIKSSLIGVSEYFLVEDGQLDIGRWQSLYFMEFDGPRDRHIDIKIIGN